MLINKDWLGRIFRDEAGGDGGEGGGGDSSADAGGDSGGADADAVAKMAAEGGDKSGDDKGGDRPDWLLDKYATDGKSIEEATSEQAKAYNELSGKFGAFTGAPETYEVALSEELTEAGVKIADDDPMLEAAKEFAKSSNMNQEGFNGIVNLYAMQQLAESKADEEYKAEQMKALGPSGESRIQNIQQWAGKNLDAETVTSLEGMATSVESVKAIERLISMTRGAAVDIDDSKATSSVTSEEVQKMQFEKDENGNRRINTDKAFNARYQKMKNEFYGTEEHREMIG